MEISIKYDAVAPRNPATHRVLKDMEALFISQMLTHMGIGQADSPFSGGIGETQFTSFLIDEYAKILTPHLDLGIDRGTK